MAGSGSLQNLFEFLDVYEIERCTKAEDVKPGDIVVCWCEEDEQPNVLGTVKHVGAVSLPEGHPDGECGDVFVLDSNKNGKHSRMSITVTIKNYV